MNQLDSITMTSICFSLSALILMNAVHYYKQDKLGKQMLAELKLWNQA